MLLSCVCHFFLLMRSCQQVCSRRLLKNKGMVEVNGLRLCYVYFQSDLDQICYFNKDGGQMKIVCVVCICRCCIVCLCVCVCVCVCVFACASV